jgi:hypothetical protein
MRPSRDPMRISPVLDGSLLFVSHATDSINRPCSPHTRDTTHDTRHTTHDTRHTTHDTRHE